MAPHQRHIAGEPEQGAQPRGRRLLVPLPLVKLHRPAHRGGEQGEILHRAVARGAPAQLGQELLFRFLQGFPGGVELLPLVGRQGSELRKVPGLQPPPRQLVRIDEVRRSGKGMGERFLGQVVERLLPLSHRPGHRRRPGLEVADYRLQVGHSADKQHPLMAAG